MPTGQVGKNSVCPGGELINNTGSKSRIFFPKSTSDGAGFLKGGGDLPRLGFPPPSRSRRTLKLRCTITVGSNKACSLDTGVVDGRSTTAETGISSVGCRLLALADLLGGPNPSGADLANGVAADLLPKLWI